MCVFGKEKAIIQNQLAKLNLVWNSNQWDSCYPPNRLIISKRHSNWRFFFPIHEHITHSCANITQLMVFNCNLEMRIRVMSFWHWCIVQSEFIEFVDWPAGRSRTKEKHLSWSISYFSAKSEWGKPQSTSKSSIKLVNAFRTIIIHPVPFRSFRG